MNDTSQKDDLMWFKILMSLHRWSRNKVSKQFRLNTGKIIADIKCI